MLDDVPRRLCVFASHQAAQERSKPWQGGMVPRALAMVRVCVPCLGGGAASAGNHLDQHAGLSESLNEPGVHQGFRVEAWSEAGSENDY